MYLTTLRLIYATQTLYDEKKTASAGHLIIVRNERFRPGEGGLKWGSEELGWKSLEQPRK